MGNVLISTRGYRLRHTRPEEATLAHEAEQHAENAPYVGQWSVEQHLAALDDPDVIHAVTEERLPSGEWTGPSGFLILRGVQNEHRTVELKRLVVFDKGRGVGRATVQLAKRFAFVFLNAHRLWFDVVETNARARHVYRSAGFIEEGTLRECSEWAGERESLVMMAMLGREYRELHEPRIDTPFAPPRLEVRADTLRRYFAAAGDTSDALLRNYHHEEPVAPSRYAEARPASVLLGLIDDDEPRFLMTRRHESISAPGQICFPGGGRESADPDAVATAVRETREETGLRHDAIEPLGVLGKYYSHSGHEITPVVALLHPPFSLTPHPREVDEIVYLSAREAFRPDAYRLVQHDPDHPRAHYFISTGRSSITGPTVCLLMHLYERLAAFA